MYRTKQIGGSFFPQYKCLFLWFNYTEYQGDDEGGCDMPISFHNLEMSNRYLREKYRQDKIAITSSKVIIHPFVP